MEILKGRKKFILAVIILVLMLILNRVIFLVMSQYEGERVETAKVQGNIEYQKDSVKAVHAKVGTTTNVKINYNYDAGQVPSNYEISGNTALTIELTDKGYGIANAAITPSMGGTSTVKIKTNSGTIVTTLYVYSAKVTYTETSIKMTTGDSRVTGFTYRSDLPLILEITNPGNIEFSTSSNNITTTGDSSKYNIIPNTTGAEQSVMYTIKALSRNYVTIRIKDNGGNLLGIQWFNIQDPDSTKEDDGGSGGGRKRW